MFINLRGDSLSPRLTMSIVPKKIYSKESLECLTFITNKAVARQNRAAANLQPNQGARRWLN